MSDTSRTDKEITDWEHGSADAPDFTTTSDTPDINAIGDRFIDTVLDYYRSYTDDELTQVFARGPFAGMSERELYELAKHWDDNRKIVRLQPNADKLNV